MKVESLRKPKIALTRFSVLALFAFVASSATAAEQPTIPETFSVRIGGFLGASYSVELRDGALAYASSGRAHDNSKQQIITPTAAQWREFRQTLDDLNVWRWQTAYPNHNVTDGTQWSLDIAYPDHALHAHGDNSYPDDTGKPNGDPESTKAFNRFLAAVQRLLGGKTFQ